MSNKGQLSWQEFIVTVFERIYTDCENLLLKYGGSINPELTVKLERIKDVSRSMISFTNYNSSSSQEVSRIVYANDFLKPYLQEVMEVRILAIKYIAPSGEVIIQPKVLPGERLKGIVT